MPTPSTPATDNDSTSPSNTSMSVSRVRTTYASTCSSPSAIAAARFAISSSPASLLMFPAPGAHGAGPLGPRSLLGRVPASLHARSCCSTADSHLLDPQRRLPRRHRHALPALAAGTGPGVEVVADRVDHAEHLGPVADELRGADRCGDLALLDEVRLGHTEHEVAGRGVDLPPTE